MPDGDGQTMLDRAAHYLVHKLCVSAEPSAHISDVAAFLVQDGA